MSEETTVDVAAVLPARAARRVGLRAPNRGVRIKNVSFLILLIGAAIFMVPFFWMITTALKKPGDVYLYPPVWIPIPPQFGNVKEAMTLVPFWRFALNSGIIVSAVMIGTILSCSFSAYGFARLHAPGRDVIFLLILATMMLPGAVTLVPTYIAFNKLGWINSFRPSVR